MGLDFGLNSLYICVKDMDRAIDFYEKLFEQSVETKDEIFSVFNVKGFRFCLFDNNKVGEKVNWGDNCLPSFQVNDMDNLIDRLKILEAEIVFPVTKINENLVLEFKDTEGNDIEVYSRISIIKEDDNMDWIELIKRYSPYDEQEKKDKEVILDCIDTFKDILTRDNKIAHITSSAFILNKAKDKVLMIHHNIYNSWSWTGGHADGEKDLLAVAIREGKEETGVENIKALNSDIFSLEILPVLGHVRRGKYVSAHLHLSIAYLVEADEKEALIVKEDENSDVKWIPIEEVNSYSSEPHMQKVYTKLIDKIQQQFK